MRETYESEKHNKPEGATHYIEGTIDYLFTWYDLNSNKIYIGGGKWEDCRTICYKDLKPIPNGEVRKTIEQLEQENAQLREVLSLLCEPAFKYSEFVRNAPSLSGWSKKIKEDVTEAHRLLKK